MRSASTSRSGRIEQATVARDSSRGLVACAGGCAELIERDVHCWFGRVNGGGSLLTAATQEALGLRGLRHSCAPY